MTQQFKFGDKVRHKSYSESIGVVIVPVTIFGMTIVWFDENNNCGDFYTEDLEPIPHPDTVRLDWVTKKLQTSHVGIMIDDAGAIIYGENVPSYEVDFKAMEGSGPTIREAIDNAMQRQAAE